MTTTIAITDFCVGDALTLDRQVTGLLAPLASVEFGIVGANVGPWTVTPIGTARGVVADVGTLDIPTATYTAEYIMAFTGDETKTFLSPGVTTAAYVQVTDTNGNPYTPVLIHFTPTRGGKYG